MDIRNPFNLLRDLSRKPATIPSAILDSPSLSKEEKELIRRVGVTSGQLRQDLQADVQVQWDRQRFYHEVNRCLRGNTEISLLDGTNPTIKEMADNPDKYIGRYVYSTDPTTLNMEPDKILAVKKTVKNAQLIRVHIDNGKFVDCTPDHKFLLRNGLYIEARYLQPGMGLMPLYTKFHKRGMTEYRAVYNPSKGNYPYVHAWVVENVFKRKRKPGYVIHHKDFDKLNNDPSNLKVMKSTDHKKLHGKHSYKNHKPDCACCYCSSARGERKGINANTHGLVPWNKDLTKETDERLANVSINNTIVKAFRTKWCACGCGGQFKEDSRYPKRFIYGHNRKGCQETEEHRRKGSEGLKRSHALRRQKVLETGCKYNHKVTKVEWLSEREDTYDITTEKNHNFALNIGIVVHNSLEHWLVGAAVRLYSDYATVQSPIHNATVWITSENKKYYKVLSKLLDDVGMEEKVFDWAWTVAAYGDLFVGIEGRPSLGIITINDDRHPVQVSRVDHGGILIGFTEAMNTTQKQHLIPPWEYVHLRLLGAKRKRPIFSDPAYSEFRTMNLMSGTGTRQVSSKYGASLLLDCLPTYKRLRLAEDSLLLARLTRGITRYIWKLAINHTNMEAVNEIVDQIGTTLKHARSLNTSATSPNYDSKECLRGNTLVRLCSGDSVSIKDIADNKEYVNKYVWSINPNTHNLEPKRILNAQKTRKNAQLVRVHLDNGEHVDCTPDHPFLLRNGEFKEAQHLQSDESLMPFYSNVNEKGLIGYERIYDPGKNKWRFAHRTVSGYVPKGFCVHHLDYNKLNNDPSNLYICSNHEHHTVFHGKHTLETIEKIKKNQVAWLKDKTPENCPEFAKLIQSSKFYNYSLRTEEEVAESVRKQLETKKKNGTLIVTPSGEDNPLYGRTWDDIQGGADTSERRKAVSARMTGENNPAKSPEARAKISKHMQEHPPQGREPEVRAYITSYCKCPDGEEFRNCLVPEYFSKSYLHGHNNKGKKKAVLNHKVVQVEWLFEREDTYDLTIDGNHNFSLGVGIFVHNSPMGVTEDIFMPVWGDNNNLTFDEVGGKPDIRWIVDIDALRNQLACTLRTPLQLLGGYVDEASGALGSDAIEKLDIGFARNARRLQRALKEGIKRICQIHLAYMNMDPDPALFEVNMSETSTAEEEVIKGTFETGVEIIDRVMDILEKVDPTLDKNKVFDYMNKKILKLEGFDLANFKKQVVVDDVMREAKAEEVAEAFKRYPISNTDLIAYLPLVTKKITEGKNKGKEIKPALGERATVLFSKRWQDDWKEQWSTVEVIETKGGKIPKQKVSKKALRKAKLAEAKAQQDAQLEVEI